MLKVLLVDDEPLVLEMLKEQIPWSNYGMVVCGEVLDGSRAIEFLKENPVDIIFTDMKMPHLDGLSLIRQTKEFLPNVFFVVVSSYDDYHLVRESFQDGVFDYILKIDIDDSAVINSLLLRIKRQFALLKNTANPLSPIEQLLERIEPLHLSKGTCYCVMILSLEQNGTAVWYAQLLHMLKENTTDYAYGLFNWQIVILCYQSEEKTLKAGVHYLLSQILDKIKEASEIPPQIGISKIGEEKELTTLFFQAENVLAEAFYSPNKAYAFYDDVTVVTKPEEYQKKLFDAIIRNLRGYYPLTRLREDVSELFKVVFKSPIFPDVFKEWLMKIANAIFNEENSTHREALERLLEDIEKARTFVELKELWGSRLNELILTQTDQGTPLYDLLTTYLEQHYADKELTLQQLSEELRLNKRHLATCLLEKTGMHFRQYLNELRIKKAAFLLKNTALRINEIAEQVGYQSTEHFSRSFTALMGCSPSAYGAEQQ